MYLVPSRLQLLEQGTRAQERKLKRAKVLLEKHAERLEERARQDESKTNVRPSAPRLRMKTPVEMFQVVLENAYVDDKATKKSATRNILATVEDVMVSKLQTLADKYTETAVSQTFAARHEVHDTNASRLVGDAEKKSQAGLTDTAASLRVTHGKFEEKLALPALGISLQVPSVSFDYMYSCPTPNIKKRKPFESVWAEPLESFDRIYTTECRPATAPAQMSKHDSSGEESPKHGASDKESALKGERASTRFAEYPTIDSRPGTASEPRSLLLLSNVKDKQEYVRSLIERQDQQLQQLKLLKLRQQEIKSLQQQLEDLQRVTQNPTIEESEALDMKIKVLQEQQYKIINLHNELLKSFSNHVEKMKVKRQSAIQAIQRDAQHELRKCTVERKQVQAVAQERLALAHKRRTVLLMNRHNRYDTLHRHLASHETPAK